MYFTGRSTTHCTRIQNNMLNSIQGDALYQSQHSTLHSNTEQDAKLNSGRCTVPVAALHTSLAYRTRCWTQFREMYYTSRSTQHCTRIQNKMLNSIQGTLHSTLHCTLIQNKMLNSIQGNILHPSQHFTLHSNTEQEADSNSGQYTAPFTALYTAL